MPIALVTGATSGIGGTFARHLAARGYDLVLVARDGQRLDTTAHNLGTEFEVAVEVLPADLADTTDCERVAARLEQTEAPIDVLINNAGFGLHTKLTDLDYSEHARALNVMCLAVLILGGAAGRAMRARGRGIIINTGSTAMILYSGNYSAVKAWVHNYSHSLATELAGTGVTVTNLAPGWVRTEFHQRAGITTTKLPDIVWIDKDRLVAEALNDAFRGKMLSVPTLPWKIATFCGMRLAPRALIRAASLALSSSRKKKA